MPNEISQHEHERDEARADAKRLRDALDRMLAFVDKYSVVPVIKSRYGEAINQEFRELADEADKAVRGA